MTVIILQVLVLFFLLLSPIVLYYNLSSSGLQTVSVLRCDWEGEVVVMECTQNGQQDGE